MDKFERWFPLFFTCAGAATAVPATSIVFDAVSRHEWVILPLVVMIDGTCIGMFLFGLAVFIQGWRS